MRHFFQSLFICLFFSSMVFGQGTLLQYRGSGSYVYIERTDLRRYDNGKYTGLMNREVRSFISPVGVPAGGRSTDRYYDGNFYVLEETRKSAMDVGIGINTSIPSHFKITQEGELVMLNDNGYPSFRSFPSFTTKKINYGDRWQAKAERVVDPLNKGVRTKMPIYVEYTYLRDEKFHGEDVYVISAQWATRYGLAATLDFGGDRDLKFAQGSHKATMFVSKNTGNALVVRDLVDEEFEYFDGTKVGFKGSISMFTEYPPAYDRSKLFPALQRIASVSKDELKQIMENPVKDADFGSFDASKGTEKVAESIGKGKNSSDFSMGDSFENSDSGIGNESAGKNHSSILEKKIESESDMSDDWAVQKNNTGRERIANIGNNEGKQTNGSHNKKTGVGKNSKLREEIKASGLNIIEENNKKESLSKTSEEDNSGFEKKITVENTSSGIRLTMQNLNFKPDSAELLNGENQRLDQIAELLKLVPEQMILIEGHTASVGNPKGELNLSRERAESISKALVKRGIKPEKIICRGSGGTKAIADNSTPAGRAKNRRVEITILE